MSLLKNISLSAALVKHVLHFSPDVCKSFKMKLGPVSGSFIGWLWDGLCPLARFSKICSKWLDICFLNGYNQSLCITCLDSELSLYSKVVFLWFFSYGHVPPSEGTLFFFFASHVVEVVLNFVHPQGHQKCFTSYLEKINQFGLGGKYICLFPKGKNRVVPAKSFGTLQFLFVSWGQQVL